MLILRQHGPSRYLGIYVRSTGDGAYRGPFLGAAKSYNDPVSTTSLPLAPC